MKVKLTMPRGGPHGSWNAGDEYECTDREGLRLIEQGKAVPVREAKLETATREPTERAVTRRTRSTTSKPNKPAPGTTKRRKRKTTKSESG